VFTALQNIVPSHLADGTLYDFKGLRVGEVGEDMDGGDIAFDAPSRFDEPTSILKFIEV
jgi:tRNA 2-thiocytidine biosynthesis protein TtcA